MCSNSKKNEPLVECLFNLLPLVMCNVLCPGDEDRERRQKVDSVR